MILWWRWDAVEKIEEKEEEHTAEMGGVEKNGMSCNDFSYTFKHCE